MKRLASALVAACLLVPALAVWADDTVYFTDPATKKETSLKGTIDKEDPTGIKLKTKGGVKEIPALDVTMIVYDTKIVDPLAFRDPFKNETNALRPGTKAAARADLLKAAAVGYQDLDAKLRDLPFVHRYLQYKIAQVAALQARDDPSQVDAAIKALTEYKSAFGDGWEIVPALQTLARLQEDKGDAAAAGQTYADLAEVPGLPASMKLQSQLQGAQLLLRVGKLPEAEAKLKQVTAALSADDPQRALVDVYLVQVQIGRNDLAGVEDKLKAAVRGSEDKRLRALAHNFLGDYYRLKKDLDLAFWEYLKVDTMYPDDKEETAKALYYLAQLFDKAKNDPNRAAECLAKLKSQQFEGTLYQRMAASEKKAP